MMITSLENLAAETQREFELLGKKSHLEDMVLRTPGISEKRADELKTSIPDLPISYLDVAKKYNLLGVCVGWFLVWPGGRFETLEASIIDALNDSFFPKEFMEKHRMYQVGCYNTDLICVTAGTDKFANGEILL